MKLNQLLKRERLGLILFLAIAIGLVIRLYLSWLDVETLIDKFLGEDHFYYLTLARNIALGKGVTFDGLAATNGFHPLYPFMLVPLFKFTYADISMPVHLALTMLSLFNVLTAIFVFKIVEILGSRKAGLLAALLWLFNPYVISLMLTGVEGALYAFFISASIFWYLRIRLRNQYTLKNMLILGVLIGITFLCRTDAIFLFVAVLLDLGYKLLRQSGLSVNSLSRTAIYCFAALAVASPWLIWNLANFGTIMQTSGQSIAYMMHQRYLFERGSYLSFSFVVGLACGVMGLIDLVLQFATGHALLSVLVLGLVGGVALSQVARQSGNRLKDWKIGNLNFALLFVIFLVAYYALWQWTTQPWYFMSMVLVATLYIGLATDFLGRNINVGKYISPNKALTLIFVFIAMVFVFRGAMLYDSHTPNIALYQSAVWIKENIPEDQRIGAFEAGILGYYSGKTVINLDGVMNNNAAQAFRNNKLLEYIEQEDIAYIALDQVAVNTTKYFPFFRNGEADQFLSRLTEVHVVQRPSSSGWGDSVLYQFNP